MKVLVLDDDEERHAAFRQMLKEQEAVHVRNIADFIEAIRTTKFHLMFLDHDLEDFVQECYGSYELTGVNAAKYIAEMHPLQHPLQVIIHSWNPEGALRMKQILQDVGISVLVKPFSVDWVH